jgi:hypothetical protein
MLGDLGLLESDSIPNGAPRGVKDSAGDGTKLARIALLVQVNQLEVRRFDAVRSLDKELQGGV